MRHSGPSTIERAGPWLRVLVGVGILVALMAVLGRDAFAAGLRVITPTAVLAALGIGLATTVISALRWRFVARRVGLELGVPDAVAETYRAQFLNAVLPSGVLGDVDRAVRHGRDAGDVGRGARAVVLERTAGQVVLVTAAVAVLPTQPALMAALLGGTAPARVAAVVVGVLLLGAVVSLVVRAHRLPDGRWRRVLHRTLADLRAGLLARDAWPVLLGLSVAALAGYLTLFMVAARAAGVTASTAELLPLFVLALMAMGLPINIGGWGPREGVTALGFWMAGLGAPLGITVSVAYGVLALIASLPGGLVLLVRRRRARSAGPDPVAVPAQRPASTPPRGRRPVPAPSRPGPRHAARR